MSGEVYIEITPDPCPVLDHSNERYVAMWAQLGPAERKQFVDGLVARSILPTSTVDLESSVAPEFEYPPWHACVTSGRLAQERRGGGEPWPSRDEGDRQRSFLSALNGVPGTDWRSPIGQGGINQILEAILNALKKAGQAIVDGVSRALTELGKLLRGIMPDWTTLLAWGAVILGVLFLVFRARQAGVVYVAAAARKRMAR